MEKQIFRSEQARAVMDFVQEYYGDELEFLWEKFSDNAIYRNRINQKWYALLMMVGKDKLGLDSTERVEILDLRFVKNEALDFAANTTGIYPGYHMNKNNWITIILDGTVPTGMILDLLKQSYELSLLAK